MLCVLRLQCCSHALVAFCLLAYYYESIFILFLHSHSQGNLRSLPNLTQTCSFSCNSSSKGLTSVHPDSVEGYFLATFTPPLLPQRHSQTVRRLVIGNDGNGGGGRRGGVGRAKRAPPLTDSHTSLPCAQFSRVLSPIARFTLTYGIRKTRGTTLNHLDF